MLRCAHSRESRTACITTARTGTRSSFAAAAPGRGIWLDALEIPWAAESPLIVGLTSIFWREAWKYGERAYRYCCHDLGHAMMSVLLAARALGLPGGRGGPLQRCAPGPRLGLAESDEAPMAFLVFPAQNDFEWTSRPARGNVRGDSERIVRGRSSLRAASRDARVDGSARPCGTVAARFHRRIQSIAGGQATLSNPLQRCTARE